MSDKNLELCLLENVSDVESLLRTLFSTSSSRVKKYFPKTILNKSLNKQSILKVPLNFANALMINPLYEGDEIKIIAETDDFLVFAKNENQFIHPLSYDESNNCLSFFRMNGRGDLLNINQSQYDRGLLYRLDYETSGVVIYVKSDELYKSLRTNFSELAKEKIYLCWVDGLLSGEKTLKHSFSKSGPRGMKVEVADYEDHQTKGELSYRVLEQDLDLKRTLVEVKLKTGLRHQIRAQMAYHGYPLIGDELYGGPKAQRLFLHALTYTLLFKGQEFSWTFSPIKFK